MSDIDTAVVVDGLKALDPKWPIREADIGSGVRPNRFMSTRPSVMGPMRSSPPCDRHAAELTLLSVVDAEAATLCC